MFYLGGVGLAFFLILLLLSKSNKTAADKILTGWLVLVTAHLLLFYFRKTGLYPETLGMDIPLPLMHGPFLYLYTLALTNRSRSLPSSLLHFIPVVAILIYLLHFFALPVEQKIFVYQNKGAGYETFNLLKTVAIIISGVLYVILSSLALRKHRLSIANQFSNTEKINLEWLQYLIYWIGVIWALVIFANDTWIFAAAVLFILFIGYFGIRQVGIFYGPEAASPGNKMQDKLGVPVEIQNNNIEVSTESRESDQEQGGQEKRKYQKSGLSADGSEKLHRQLTRVMQDEKIFRESELSLTDLAARLDTQPNYLSRVINEREGKNFYDYINTLRIEEFKRVAASAESRKYTLLALAQHCGFNSKSTFNRYFKKVTGQSPSEFKLVESTSEK